MKKAITILCSTAAAISMIMILLISAFEAGIYGNFDFYEEEYEKYNVKEELEMEMPDIMDVTRQMMAYLRGEKAELSVETTIAGETKDFFNEQDRFHMGEVKDLFLGGLALRRGAAAVFVVSLILLVACKANLKRILPKAFEVTIGAFFALCATFGILLSQNFTKYFVVFHEIFFDNDLWIFDPATDYMIRMLPEGFFMDMTFRIGSIFVCLLAAVIGLCVGTQMWERKENKENK